MPQPLYPSALRRGSRIAVSAPSSGVPAALHGRLDIVIEHLRKQGFDVEEGSCLRDEHDSASAPAAERAAELTRLLLRDDVHAIIPPWGGELAIELLDRLDWTALSAARPKWLVGYSDTSTLLLPITLRMGWATAHGPCLMDLAPGQDDPLTSGAMEALALSAGERLMQQQSSHWQLKGTDFAQAPSSTYQLTETTRWWPLSEVPDVQFAGRLIGGCIDTLMHIAGTPHGDVRSFIAANATDAGTVLYLENAEQSPTDLVRALHRLRWAGWLDGIAGLLLGRSAAPDSSDPLALRYADAVRSTLSGLPCPVLVDIDIGHRPPQMVLINGAIAHVTWTAAQGGWIEQLLA
jgi:muramoyltetrapeptide carboxypeptidase LdcA involved in peptidoglycan recycling